MKFKLVEDTLLEKYDSRLAKVLGNKIFQTSNPSGQGQKYELEINFIRSNPKEFNNIKPKSFIVAHHINGDHSDDREENIAFLVFESHSKYHSEVISIADSLIQDGRFDYDELDYLARVKQINVYIDKCNQLYGDKFAKVPLINIDSSYIDYVKHLFAKDDIVQKAISELSSLSTTTVVTLKEVRNKMIEKGLIK